jgi:phage shock protein PspC (stress-responsive transcriptional regulator)
VTETIDTTTPLDQTPLRRLKRVRDGRWLGGVAAGLGRYFDVNPLVYRIAFAALAFVGGTGLLLYVAAWLVMPAEDRDESIAVETLREHRDRPWLLAGVGLLGFFALLALAEADFWPGAGNVWLAALLGGGALVWWHTAKRDDTPVAPAAAGPGEPASTPPATRRPHRPSLFAPVLGLLLAAGGAFGLLAILDVYDLDVDIALAVAVAIVGAAVVAGAFTGRRVGGLVVVGFVLLGAFGLAASAPVSVSSGIGEKVERPFTAAQLDDTYELGIGDFTVDLSSVELTEGTTKVEVRLGIGELVVTVPDDVALVVDGHVAAGDLDVLGETEDGTGSHERVELPGPSADSPVLELDADVALGRLEVRR